MNSLFQQAQDAATSLEDQTKVQSGGDFEYETPPAGKTPARFIGYVDCGMRKQKPYQGKDKPDADEVRLYFELNGPKHQKEVEVEGETKKFTNMISVKVTKKLNDKATFTKLFKKMVYGRENITHMSQMLGEGFLIEIKHNEEKNPKEGQKPRVFANMRDDDGTWLIGAPMYEDPMSGETIVVPVPEMTQAGKLLLWDAPTKEQWASIFVDGTRTAKNEKGEEIEVSRNWLQEDILTNAVNFEGSPLQELLGGVGDLDLNPEAPETAAGEEKAPAEEKAPTEEEKPADAPSGAAADVLADLGLA